MNTTEEFCKKKKLNESEKRLVFAIFDYLKLLKAKQLNNNNNKQK